MIMNSETESNKLHVAFFPWLAFGHIIPFLKLAQLLAQKGHKISFISTRRNIQRLPKIPPNLLPHFNLISLTLPSSNPNYYNLPQNEEATMDVPYHLVPHLKIAFDGLQQPLTHFLETSTPDWIIYDFVPHWLPPIASKLGICGAFFSIFNARFLDLFVSSSELSNDVVSLRQHEAKQLSDYTDVNDSGISDYSRLASVASGSKLILVRSCMEIEADFLNKLHQIYQRPVVPVGLMPPSSDEDTKGDNDETWVNLLEWLNKQERASVVYVALGSEVRPSQNDFNELALGLELAQLPFFWVLRKGSDTAELDSIELPDGLEERTKGRGVVWKDWAPQLKILGHESIGGFLTHCGWGSIVEGLCYGRPLVMLPYIGDQGLNAKVLVEKKVGVEIPRDENDGSFNRNLVAESVRLVVMDEEGGIYREKAKEMSAIYGDRNLHQSYIEKLVEELKKYHR